MNILVYLGEKTANCCGRNEQKVVEVGQQVTVSESVGETSRKNEDGGRWWCESGGKSGESWKVSSRTERVGEASGEELRRKKKFGGQTHARRMFGDRRGEKKTRACC